MIMNISYLYIMKNMQNNKNYLILTVAAVIVIVLSCNAKNIFQGEELNPTIVLDIAKEPIPYKTVRLNFNIDSLYLGMWSYKDQYLQPSSVYEYYIKDNFFYITLYAINDLRITDTFSYKINLSEIKVSNIEGNYFWHGNLPTGYDNYYSISAFDSAIHVYTPSGKYRKNSAEKIYYVTESIEKHNAYLNYCRKNDSSTIIRWDCGMTLIRWYQKNGNYYLMHYSDDNTPEISRVKPKINGEYVILYAQNEDLGRNMAVKLNDSSQLYVLVNDKSEDDFVISDHRIASKDYLYSTIVDSFYFGKGFKWR